MDDVTLIRGTLDGRLEELEILVERHQPALYGFVLAETADPEVADEIVRTTFVRAWEHLEGFRFEVSFKSWLHEIAIGEHRSQRRSRRRVVEPGSRKTAGDDPSPDDTAATDTTHPLRGKLGAAIGRLPARLRTVLLLRAVSDLPFREIGRIQGVAPGAAKRTYYRAVKQLEGAASWSCLSRRTWLVDLAEGTLDGAGRARLERHLERCRSCAETLGFLRAARRRLAPIVPGPDEEHLGLRREAILGRVRETGGPARRARTLAPRRPPRAFPWSAIFAATTAIVIAVIGWSRFESTFRPSIQTAGSALPVPNDVDALDHETLLVLAEIAEVVTPPRLDASGVPAFITDELAAREQTGGL